MVEMSGPRTLENTKQWMFAKLKAGVHQMVSADVKITSSVIENLSGLATVALDNVGQGNPLLKRVLMERVS